MRLFKRALTATLPVMTGYLILGLAFGILLHEAGFGAGWSLAMGAFIYAGSMQYVGLDLLRSNASLAAVALTTLMVNARHLFYGVSMIDKYRGTGAVKPYLIFGLTDETYSLLCADPPADVPPERLTRYRLYVTLLDHLWWVSGCVLGSLAGTLLPVSFEGLDFALTALFVTVFTDQWMKTGQHLPALIGAGASLACLLVCGPDTFLIPAMLLITLLLLILPHGRMTDAEGGDGHD